MSITAQSLRDDIASLEAALSEHQTSHAVLAAHYAEYPPEVIADLQSALASATAVIRSRIGSFATGMLAHSGTPVAESDPAVAALMTNA